MPFVESRNGTAPTGADGAPGVKRELEQDHPANTGQITEPCLSLSARAGASSEDDPVPVQHEPYISL